MKKSTEHISLWRYALLLLFVPGMFASCKDNSTGPGGNPGPGPDPDPVPASITAFSTSDELISAGETITLTWDVSGDAPITLTFEPGGTDVSGETSAEVTPDEETTYRLMAENEGGNDEAEVTVEMIAAGETAIEVDITGLPAGTVANVAITDHHTVMQWVKADRALTGLSAATYTVAASGVSVSGSTYLPDEDLQTLAVANDEIVSVQIVYNKVSGSIYATNPDVQACSGEI